MGYRKMRRRRGINDYPSHRGRAREAMVRDLLLGFESAPCRPPARSGSYRATFRFKPKAPFRLPTALACQSLVRQAVRIRSEDARARSEGAS